MRRRHSLALPLLLALRGAASAQAPWPSRPVRIIVPFGLGGSADVAARFLAEPLSQALGQPVVIENRPGAGAVIGTEAAAKAAPDGHTLLLMSNTHTANETLLPQRPYVLMRDLMPVAAINSATHVLAVHPSLGVTSVAALIAKAKAAPGTIDFASSGPGTPYHIAGEVFASMAGIQLNHIPFRGSNDARTALLAGQVPMMFDAVPTMRDQIGAGRVVGLATTGTRRSPLLPELPVVADALPGYEAAIWLGLMAPRGTPDPVVARLHAEVGRILEAGAAREAMARGGAAPMPMSVAEFDAFLRRDIDRQREWIRMAKIQVG
ncbi:tripartite tricarboxylate transporter substrate binding protein [Dankookia sp. GCM10030260]|uniref:tripartite tricarboxylate transporter substrate binding protein n=1 Tax=Dankookia sp. GCM10030260 TaxID=3273390 RepID=UPI0036227436